MNYLITSLIVSMILIFSTTDNDTTVGGGGGKGPGPKIVNQINVLK